MKKILLVEDDPVGLRLVSAVLKNSGYDVETASNGQDGLEKAREIIPDLIVLDVLMPKMDGYEMCRLLKFDERYQNIPVIFLTAKNQEQDKTVGDKVGGTDYLMKPVDSHELLMRIEKYIE